MGILFLVFIVSFILCSDNFPKMIKNNDDEIVSKIRELSKKNFERETIRDLIEEKYSIILSNDFLDKYI